jgi:hypothetical protein
VGGAIGEGAAVVAELHAVRHATAKAAQARSSPARP